MHALRECGVKADKFQCLVVGDLPTDWRTAGLLLANVCYFLLLFRIVTLGHICVKAYVRHDPQSGLWLQVRQRTPERVQVQEKLR